MRVIRAVSANSDSSSVSAKRLRSTLRAWVHTFHCMSLAKGYVCPTASLCCADTFDMAKRGGAVTGARSLSDRQYTLTTTEE